MKPKHAMKVLLAGLILAVGMGASGCPISLTGLPDFSPLDGTWSIQRGDVHVRFSWTSDGGGETTSDSTGGMLQPVDVNDFPSSLKPIAQQWNDGLAQLNASLDVAIPDSVIVTFPHGQVMRVTDANDATKTGDGLINSKFQFLFAGDISGAAQGSDQGGGAVLSVASINGQFDVAALTVSGKIARTLIVALSGSNGSLFFTAQISVDYTGARTADMP